MEVIRRVPVSKILLGREIFILIKIRKRICIYRLPITFTNFFFFFFLFFSFFFFFFYFFYFLLQAPNNYRRWAAGRFYSLHYAGGAKI